MIVNRTLWLNRKNQRLYQVVSGHVINSTNSHDGQVMVVYHDLENPGQLYVRDRGEFYVKFLEVDDGEDGV